MSGVRRISADRLSTTAAEAGGATSPTEARLTLFGQPLELPSPRAMAVAVMALLAFGVIVGTANFSLASSPLRLTVNEPARAATSTPSAPGPSALSSPAASSTPAASGSSSSGASVSAGPAPVGNTGSSSSNSSSSSSSSSSASVPKGSTTANGLPPIKHVWVIELGDQGYANTFDATSSDTYLNKTLASQGEVVPNVYASATSDLANEVGLVSGQGPTVQTENDCPTYNAVTPGTIGTDQQVSGDGCVYPTGTATFMSELSTAGDSYKAYVQGQGITPTTSCIHPDVAATDNDFALTSATGYVTWRNPLVYFSDITSGSCSYEDTGLAKLKSDLSSSATTPNVSFIFPNPCDDGSDTPCLSGAPAGTQASDKFLQSVVPEIMNSAAYKADGMILVTFAEAPQTGASADHSSCCDQPAQFPNLPSADYEPSGTTTTTTGTTTTGTSTSGTDTTGTGTDTTAASSSTTPAATTSGTDTTASGTTTAITIGGVAATVGTTTMPAGLITGTNTSTTATDTTGTSTTACPTTTTATTTTGTTTTGTGTTTTDTSGSTTAGTGTTAGDTCCPTDTTTGTTTTGTGTTTTDTTGSTSTDTTGSTTTGATTTDTGASSVCCPTTSTGTTTTGTGTTTTGTGTSTATTGTTTTGTGTTGTGTGTTATGCPTTGSSTSASPTGGGGQVGMLVLSKYVMANDPDTIDYFNTFSITGSLEELFNLKYTGYADTTGLPLFSSFLYSNYNSG